MTDHDESDTPREVPTEAPELPQALAARLAGYAWHRNLVGKAGANVHRLHRTDSPALYLKHGDGDAAIAIADEFARLQWFADRWPAWGGVPFLLTFRSRSCCGACVSGSCLRFCMASSSGPARRSGPTTQRQNWRMGARPRETLPT